MILADMGSCLGGSRRPSHAGGNPPITADHKNVTGVTVSRSEKSWNNTMPLPMVYNRCLAGET
jgi:hypothetical protein